MKLTEHNEKVLSKFSEMMINRMKQVKASDYKQGWLGKTTGGSPMNLDGRNYSGGNVFMLMLDCAMQNFDLPIYCTIRQANRLGAHINKGEKSMPVIYWDFSVKDQNGKPMRYEDYKNMSASEQQKCQCIPFLKSYNVFNIQQTNLADVKPDKVEELKGNFRLIDVHDDKGMYANQSIDEMLHNQSWVCPIQYDKPSDGAFYSGKDDRIVVPMKKQFKIHRKSAAVYEDGQEFYSSLLHEMIHSTGAPNRLGRDLHNRFGDKKYAKEELVAELGAARISNELGFHSRIIDNSAAYIDSWIGAMNEDPTFILTVMTDVEKASRMIIEKLVA